LAALSSATLSLEDLLSHRFSFFSERVAILSFSSKDGISLFSDFVAIVCGRLQDGISLFSDFVAIVCGRLQDGISLFSDFVGNFSDTSTLSLFDLDSVEKKSK
jgi:hypothetical protein